MSQNISRFRDIQYILFCVMLLNLHIKNAQNL